MFDDENSNSDLTARIADLKNQIEADFQEAALAYIFRKLENSKAALRRRWMCQLKLAELLGTTPPELPIDPKAFFQSWDWTNKGKGQDPGTASESVPRRPYPNDGSGETSLRVRQSQNE
jgi:hypothetical protein